uniref:Uncharacterized protein n=1 Tax=Arundo donax TaxID=35708 RepID=A0A0A9BL73_ARUDO
MGFHHLQVRKRSSSRSSVKVMLECDDYWMTAATTHVMFKAWYHLRFSFRCR